MSTSRVGRTPTLDEKEGVVEHLPNVGSRLVNGDYDGPPVRGEVP